MSEELDDHGQPVTRAYSWARLRESRLDELIGLCRGILADGVIVVEEVRFLRDWLRRNRPTRLTPIGKQLFDAARDALVRGRLDPDGEGHLLDVMMKLIGGTPESPDDASMSTTLPLDDPPPPVTCADHSFCFTGKFRFGTRAECAEAVLNGGGEVHSNVHRDTCFLVIGAVGSRDWAHSSMGRKIEAAIEMRECGLRMRIISEDHWANSLGLSCRSGRRSRPKRPARRETATIVISVGASQFGVAGVDGTVREGEPPREAEPNASLERMGEKSAENVTRSIEGARGRPLDRLLAGLGIRHVGSRTAYVLAEHFGSLDAVMKASQQELESVNEIGPVVAESIHDFFHNEAGKEAIRQLKEVGIDPKTERRTARGEGRDQPLAGQTVVVTGTLERFERKEIEELIQKLGGKASGSVSKKTSFVVAGESVGSKLDKARELDVPVLSEGEFLEKVGMG